MSKAKSKKLRNNTSPETKLKFLSGSYKRANEMGMLNEFLAYYKLKQINKEGYISLKRGYITKISYLLNCSRGHSYVIIEKLIRRKILKRRYDNNSNLLGYELISYNKLWEFLGFNTQKRTGDMKIITVSSMTGKIIEEYQAREISYDLKKQCNAVFRKNTHVFYQANKKNSDTDNIPYSFKKKKSRKFSHLTYIKKNEKSIRIMTNYPDNNFEITLSCKGTAELFGYSSSMQGHKLLKKLEKINFISITKNKTLLLSKDISPSLLDELKISGDKFWNNCFGYNNYLFYRKPNLINVNHNNLNMLSET